MAKIGLQDATVDLDAIGQKINDAHAWQNVRSLVHSESFKPFKAMALRMGEEMYPAIDTAFETVGRKLMLPFPERRYGDFSLSLTYAGACYINADVAAKSGSWDSLTKGGHHRGEWVYGKDFPQPTACARTPASLEYQKRFTPKTQSGWGFAVPVDDGVGGETTLFVPLTFVVVALQTGAEHEKDQQTGMMGVDVSGLDLKDVLDLACYPGSAKSILSRRAAAKLTPTAEHKRAKKGQIQHVIQPLGLGSFYRLDDETPLMSAAEDKYVPVVNGSQKARVLTDAEISAGIDAGKFVVRCTTMVPLPGYTPMKIPDETIRKSAGRDPLGASLAILFSVLQAAFEGMPIRRLATNDYRRVVEDAFEGSEEAGVLLTPSMLEVLVLWRKAEDEYQNLDIHRSLTINCHGKKLDAERAHILATEMLKARNAQDWAKVAALNRMVLERTKIDDKPPWFRYKVVLLGRAGQLACHLESTLLNYLAAPEYNVPGLRQVGLAELILSEEYGAVNQFCSLIEMALDRGITPTEPRTEVNIPVGRMGIALGRTCFDSAAVTLYFDNPRASGAEVQRRAERILNHFFVDSWEEIHSRSVVEDIRRLLNEPHHTSADAKFIQTLVGGLRVLKPWGRVSELSVASGMMGATESLFLRVKPGAGHVRQIEEVELPVVDRSGLVTRLLAFPTTSLASYIGAGRLDPCRLMPVHVFTEAGTTKSPGTGFSVKTDPVEPVRSSSGRIWAASANVVKKKWFILLTYLLDGILQFDVTGESMRFNPAWFKPMVKSGLGCGTMSGTTRSQEKKERLVWVVAMQEFLAQLSERFRLKERIGSSLYVMEGKSLSWLKWREQGQTGAPSTESIHARIVGMLAGFWDGVPQSAGVTPIQAGRDLINHLAHAKITSHFIALFLDAHGWDWTIPMANEAQFSSNGASGVRYFLGLMGGLYSWTTTSLVHVRYPSGIPSVGLYNNEMQTLALTATQTLTDRQPGVTLLTRLRTYVGQQMALQTGVIRDGLDVLATELATLDLPSSQGDLLMDKTRHVASYFIDPAKVDKRWKTFCRAAEDLYPTTERRDHWSELDAPNLSWIANLISGDDCAQEVIVKMPQACTRMEALMYAMDAFVMRSLFGVALKKPKFVDSGGEFELDMGAFEVTKTFLRKWYDSGCNATKGLESKSDLTATTSSLMESITVRRCTRGLKDFMDRDFISLFTVLGNTVPQVFPPTLCIATGASLPEVKYESVPDVSNTAWTSRGVRYDLNRTFRSAFPFATTDTVKALVTQYNNVMIDSVFVGMPPAASLIRNFSLGSPLTRVEAPGIRLRIRNDVSILFMPDGVKIFVEGERNAVYSTGYSVAADNPRTIALTCNDRLVVPVGYPTPACAVVQPSQTYLKYILRIANVEERSHKMREVGYSQAQIEKYNDQASAVRLLAALEDLGLSSHPEDFGTFNKHLYPGLEEVYPIHTEAGRVLASFNASMLNSAIKAVTMDGISVAEIFNHLRQKPTNTFRVMHVRRVSVC